MLPLLSVALYWQVLGFEYVWDDNLLFLDKSALLNDALSWRLLAEPVLPGTSYLRPLVFLTLYAEFHIFGQKPLVSHVINLLIYTCNVWLVFYVCRQLLMQLRRQHCTSLAFLAGVVYAVHPALVETTAWVAGRFDLMSTFFILAAIAIYTYKPGSPSLPRSIFAVTLMAGALLSKELGAVLPMVLLCIWLAIQGKGRSWMGRNGLAKEVLIQNRYLLLLSAVIFGAYVILRKNSAGGIYHSTMSVEYIRDVIIQGLTPLEALKFYAVKIFFPFSSINPLHPAYELKPHGIPEMVASVLVVGALLFLSLQCLRNKSPAAWVFGAGMFCLLPVLHFIPLSTGGNIGHERFLTAPLAFFCISMVLVDYKSLIEFTGLRGQFANRWLLVAATGWIFIALLTTYTVLPIWSSDLRLWNWAYHKHPNFFFAQYNYMYGALKAGRADLVEKEINFVRERDGGLDVPDQIIYANLLLRKGDPESLDYLRGIMFALPKFHEMKDGERKVLGMPVPKIGIAGVYGDYALGLMMFKGDAVSALKYSKIAEWYLAESEKIALFYPRVAILLALGRDRDAQDLFDSLEPLFYSKKERLKKDPALILEKYCKASSGEDASRCRDLIEKAKKMAEKSAGAEIP